MTTTDPLHRRSRAGHRRDAQRLVELGRSIEGLSEVLRDESLGMWLQAAHDAVDGLKTDRSDRRGDGCGMLRETIRAIMEVGDDGDPLLTGCRRFVLSID